MTCFVFRFFASLALLLGATAPATAALAVRFKVENQGQVVACDQQLALLRKGDTIEARALEDGRALWSTKIAALITGEHTFALCGKRAYVLTKTGLMVIDAESGKIDNVRAMAQPNGVRCTAAHVVVSHQKGLTRLDPRAKHLDAFVATRGRLLAVDGHRAILFRKLHEKAPKSPQRLVVVDMAARKEVYEFKLLRNGAHRLLRAEAGEISLLDYSRGQEGKPKLYFTRTDHQQRKKLSDVSLAAHYPKGEVQGFDGVALADGRLFIVSQGGRGKEHVVLLYRRQDNKILWKRSLPAGASDLLLHDDVLWIALQGEQAELVGLDAKDGHVRQRVTLDARPRGALLVGGGGLVFSTAKSLWRLAPPSPTAPPTPKKDWRLYRDTLAGYTLSLPKSWRLVKERIRHFGKGRFSVPFVRYRQEGERWIFLGSLHVLVRPAAGQSVDALAQSVLQQWQRRMGSAKHLKTERFKRGDKSFLLASYAFKNRYQRQEQSRSLCVVSHGFAFELRARTSPQGEAIWPEIIEALKLFSPRPELVGAKEPAKQAAPPASSRPTQ